MACANDHCLRPIISLNLVDQIKSTKKLTKNRAQELLTQWTAEGYFREIDDKLYFGPRIQCEFGQYLHDHYAETIAQCSLCKLSVFKVQIVKTMIEKTRRSSIASKNRVCM